MILFHAPTVRERIQSFLERRSGEPICDLCIGRELGLRSPGQISAAVVVISRTHRACVRLRSFCRCCGEFRKTTRIERLD